MLAHFQVSLANNSMIKPSWQFSFFFQGKYYKGMYHYNGNIDWTPLIPEEEDRADLEQRVHDLMLYHVYEDHST